MSEKEKSAASGKQHAPTLYFIAGFKIFKGVLLLVAAIFIYSMAKKDLPSIFDNFISWIHLDPENKFFSNISDKLGDITPANVRKFALLPFGYGLFLFASGLGLALRAKWAIWLAIGESAFFIPIEVYELVRPHKNDGGQHHDQALLIILALNVLIVWYLYKNRNRLFRHHS